MKKHLLPLLLTAGALVAGGCAGTRKKVDGSDTTTFLPALRSSWVLADRPAADESSSSSRTQLDLELSGGRSGFLQSVASGDQVEIGATTFGGPDSLDVAFDFLRVQADVRLSLREANGVGVEGFVGLSYSDLDVALSSASQSDSEDFRIFGPLIGATIFYEPAAWLRLYGEGSINPSLTLGGNDFSFVNTLDVGASLPIRDWIRLRASWHYVNYKADTGFGSSDLDLTASGPSVALAFTW